MYEKTIIRSSMIPVSTYIKKQHQECPVGVSFKKTFSGMNIDNDVVVYDIVLIDGIPSNEHTMIKKYFKKICVEIENNRVLFDNVIISLHPSPIFCHVHIGVTRRNPVLLKKCFIELQNGILKEKKIDGTNFLRPFRKKAMSSFRAPVVDFIQLLFARDTLSAALN